MTRAGWIGVAIAALAVAFLALFARTILQAPAADIDTEVAEESAGPEGVSIAVAPESAP